MVQDGRAAGKESGLKAKRMVPWLGVVVAAVLGAAIVVVRASVSFSSLVQQRREAVAERRYDEEVLQIVSALDSGTSGLDLPATVKTKPFEERRQIVAHSIEQLAGKESSCARRIAALHPPPDFKEVHAAYLNLFRGLSRLDSEWAQAVRRGDREDDRAAYRRLSAFGPEGYARLVLAYRRAGVHSAVLERELARVSGAAGSD